MLSRFLSLFNIIMSIEIRIKKEITNYAIVHRRVAEDAKRMNIFLSAERAERKKLSF